MKYKLIDVKDVKYAKQVKQLFKGTYWAKDRTVEEIENLIKGSTLCVGVLDSHNILIAFGRSMSDLQFVNCIYDVVVREEYRKKGLGKIVVEGILNHKKLKQIKGHVLYCKDYLKGFYEKLDFEEDETLNVMIKSVD